MDQLSEGVPPFIHISQNELFGLKRKKLKEEDISICECVYDETNPESACGERCLNVLTSTECTDGYCPCRQHCRNQKFQKCEYARTNLFKTEGRGWGLLADENIKAGQFIIEYCGEIISSEEAEKRSQAYEALGLKDAYIISLNANCFIDATKKGSLARFINHSCQPNCETRKWTVLGETRVGIFAKKDISAETELAYDYNFEWYGGATVRCLCGAANCSLFLGAKSHGFQEYNHVWEDGDDRYTVEKVPLYDSAEDEQFSSYATSPSEHESVAGEEDEYSVVVGGIKLEADGSMGSSFVVPMEGVAAKLVETESSKEAKDFTGTTAMISCIPSNTAGLKFNIGPGSTSNKKSEHTPRGRAKVSGRKQVSSKPVAELFASKEVRAEITKYEEIKNKVTAELNSLYDEIRPAIEKHEGDSQDSVPTAVAKKWIHATCAKYKADFNFHFSIIKNVTCPPKLAENEAKPSSGGAYDQNEMINTTVCKNSSTAASPEKITFFIFEKVQLPGVAPFIQISQNDFLGLKRQKLNEEDIAICECVYDGTNPESACGERCLNVLTSTECTAGYCPCREHYRNQKFQKCEYARTKLFKTEGRGWGF
ncbi:Histone-lysine N-methyltransferase ASHH1 [Abeliophyllum distichum]|uniref:Histone-lysine N-methyltransferase ASHH1 n=1 Tax=Abeliophyllum distichum TaxID=126358 RepID=A0ABD1PN53_9LAMI